MAKRIQFTWIIRDSDGREFDRIQARTYDRALEKARYSWGDRVAYVTSPHSC